MSIDILDIVIMSFYEFGHVHWIEYTYRSSCPKVYLQKLCSEKLRKIHRKTPVPGYACNFIKKGSSTGIFLRICEIFQNGYFIEHQWIYLHSSFCSCVRITRGTAKYKTCCFKDAVRREKKTIWGRKTEKTTTVESGLCFFYYYFYYHYKYFRFLERKVIKYF